MGWFREYLQDIADMKAERETDEWWRAHMGLIPALFCAILVSVICVFFFAKDSLDTSFDITGAIVTAVVTFVVCIIRQGCGVTIVFVALLIAFVCFVYKGDEISHKEDYLRDERKDYSIVDPRDKQIYRVAVIGKQHWLAQNLNYKSSGSYCYKGKNENCSKYGRLYTYAAATKACPAGWSLPTWDDIEFLKHIVERGWGKGGKYFWSKDFNGDDVVGFKVLGAGVRESFDGKYTGLDEIALFWHYSSSEDDYGVWGINHDEDFLSAAQSKQDAISIRCIMRDSTIANKQIITSGADNKVTQNAKASQKNQVPAAAAAPAPTKGKSSYNPGEDSFKDSRDGQTYNVVSVASQFWLASNLNYKVSGSYCYDDESSNCAKYGRLYTWQAAMKACPAGWELPTNDDFSKLRQYLERTYGAPGTMMKSKSFKGVDGALDGLNSFGFNALPAGDKVGSKYQLLGENTYFWTSVSSDEKRAYDWVLTASSNDFIQGNVQYALKKNAMSVRCIYRP